MVNPIYGISCTPTGLNLHSEADISPLHRVPICGTHALPQLRQFWATLKSVQMAQIRAEELPEDWEDIDGYCITNAYLSC